MGPIVADILLALGAAGAGVFCLVLIRKLRALTDLEKGVGGAIKVLGAQVEQLNRTLIDARSKADASETALAELSARAEATARQLEIMLAATQDIPSDDSGPRTGGFVRHDRKEAS